MIALNVHMIALNVHTVALNVHAVALNVHAVAMQVLAHVQATGTAMEYVDVLAQMSELIGPHYALVGQ
eukprot:214281-Pyramimonas_sp.AAC.2